MRLLTVPGSDEFRFPDDKDLGDCGVESASGGGGEGEGGLTVPGEEAGCDGGGGLSPGDEGFDQMPTHMDMFSQRRMAHRPSMVGALSAQTSSCTYSASLDQCLSARGCRRRD